MDNNKFQELVLKRLDLLDLLASQVDKLTGQVDKLTQRVDGITRDMAEIKADLQFTKKTVVRIENEHGKSSASCSTGTNFMKNGWTGTKKSFLRNM